MVKWFLIFLGFTCSAQVPVSIQGMWFSSAPSSQTPLQLASTGLIYRWVAADLPTNTALLSWTDRVAQAIWTNGASANRPTNSNNNGVWFDSTHFFTNLGGLTIGTNVDFGLIIDVIDNGKFSGDTHPSVLNNTAQLTTDNSSVIGYMFQSSSFPLTVEVNASFNALTASPFRPTNSFIDIVFTQTISNNATGGFRCYTNTVSGLTDLGSLGANQFYWGGSGGSSPTPSYPNSLMFNRPRASSAHAWLRELWIWTNSVSGNGGQDITQIVLTNFHKYATNTYGYSP